MINRVNKYRKGVVEERNRLRAENFELSARLELLDKEVTILRQENAILRANQKTPSTKHTKAEVDEAMRIFRRG